MNKQTTPLYGLLVAFALAVSFVSGQSHGKAIPSAQAGTAFDTVMKKREIRCGYVLYPPYLNKDTTTGKMTGPMVKIWDAIGERLNLKIIWSEEVTWGTMIEGLQTGRYDAVCSPVWANALRSQFVNFSTPLGYERIAAWARADDNRFDNNITHINDKSVRISVIDGEMAIMLANRLFPQATQQSLPQNASFADMMMNVTSGKADIALKETVVARDFLKHNPGSIKIIPGGESIQRFPVTILLPQKDIALKNMMDQTLGELLRDGTVQTIMNQAGLPDEWHPTAN